jgi:hypothetical protein
MKAKYWVGMAILLALWLIGRSCKIDINQKAINRVQQNYEQEVDEICKELDLPSDYFKALIILECSAQKNPPSRFEPKVFEKLKSLKAGKVNTYVGLKKSDLKDYSIQDLHLFASSWGALQIMGYHCFGLGISIDELKGKNNLRHAIIWSQKTYGAYLKNRDYRNAFHIHNTGKPYPAYLIPQTHDPTYIYKGIAYANAIGVLR